MDIKSGYKVTEIGIIPVSWAVMPLGKISDKIMVGIASAATHAYREKGVPMFRNQNIKAGRLDDSDLLFVAPEYEIAYQNKRLHAGDLLTMRTGYPGVTAIVPAQYESAQSFTTLITRPNRHHVDNTYLCYFINSEYGQHFFAQSQIGGAQKNVNAGTLRGMLIPLPSIPEQHAIAAALSDMDALLGGLDRQIAKKRDLKQATAQRLLTGQTRLPDFHGEWKPVSLASVCYMESGDGITSSGINLRFGYPCYGGNGVRGYASTWTHDGTYVLIGRVGALCGNVRIAQGRFFASEHAIVTGASPGVDVRWLGLVLGRMNLNRYSESSAQPVLTVSKLLKLNVDLPPSIGEQCAIASVLSDMDSELTALEARREKTRGLKHAMMQELLTGRIRLVAAVGGDA